MKPNEVFNSFVSSVTERTVRFTQVSSSSPYSEYREAQKGDKICVVTSCDEK